MCNSKSKEDTLRANVERLYKKRYLGSLIEEEPTYKLFGDTYINEFQEVLNNLAIAGTPAKREVFMPEDILEELDEIASENNVSLSILIINMLLKQLERDRRTTEHTKARKAYIKRVLYDGSDFIKYGEDLEQVEKNINDLSFMKYRYDELTFIENHEDERIYIYNFLINKGYTLEQIQGIETEEMEIFGTMHTKRVGDYKPLEIKTDMVLPNGKVFTTLTSWVWNSTRLGLHYIILNKSTKFNSYEEIETLISKKTSDNKKVWDLYADYYNKNLINNN